MKRALDSPQPSSRKRVRIDGPGPSRPNITRLAPTRPFPTVPRSVSATGPRSAHTEGKNRICLTRKTPLSAYLRRCKKTLYLSAMGAAIPHLLQLSVALPPILPFSPAEIHTEVTTGTVEVQDEIIPDDDDDDIEYKTRAKSTLLIVFKIGDGRDTPKPVKGVKPAADGSRRVVFAEPDQEDMDASILSDIVA
ncbi:hypothetical protein C8F01DRAFT_1056046 [Mycena amicta]|nr:hypothetical protein C8F01DRAFT_1056046 [Mycena amicta]